MEIASDSNPGLDLFRRFVRAMFTEDEAGAVVPGGLRSHGQKQAAKEAA
jgi:hypothetical protein